MRRVDFAVHHPDDACEGIPARRVARGKPILLAHGGPVRAVDVHVAEAIANVRPRREEGEFLIVPDIRRLIGIDIIRLVADRRAAADDRE